MRRLSTVASAGPPGEGSTSSQQRPGLTTSKSRGAAANALKIHNYLSSCRVQRFNSKNEIVPLTITVRSDALFLCSDRDGAIHRVVPIVVILSARYFPYAQKLHIAVSGEHDILLTATRVGTTGEGSHVQPQKVLDVIEEDDLIPCNVSGPTHSPDPVNREDEDTAVGPLPSNCVSRTLERIAESLDQALQNAARDYGQLMHHHGDEEASSSRYRTVSGVWLTRRLSPDLNASGVSACRVVVEVITDDGSGGVVDVAPQRCHLLKAMDYVTMMERLELRRRGSKRLVSVPRLTIEFWDACIALPPPAVNASTLSDDMLALMHGEAIVMKGEVEVIRIVKGLNAMSFEDASDDDDGLRDNHHNDKQVAAPKCGRRMLLLASPRRLLVVATSGTTAGTVMASIAVAAVHSIAVYSNTWPPKRMEIRYLGSGALPSSLDVALPHSPSTHPPNTSAAAASTQTTTTTANVVVVAEFITRLAAREGVHVRMAQFNPPTSDSAAQRLQRGHAAASSPMHPTAAGHSSMSTRLMASTSQFLQRARSFSPVARARSMSPDPQGSNASAAYSPSTAQSIAHTLAGGSETLKSAASSILYTISTGVHEAVNMATRRSQSSGAPLNNSASPADALTRGGFDLAVAMKQGGSKTSGGVGGAFYSVPVTGRAASEARHASEQALKTKRSSLQRRSSFTKNGSSTGLSFASLSSGDQKQQAQPSVLNQSGSFSANPASPSTANALRRPLPAISGINDYCRPSVALRQAFDDGGVRKVLLARYAVRLASEEEVRRGGTEKHAPRILVLSEHFNGADQRLVIADRRFVIRARLPYAAVTRMEAFADDVLKLTFMAHAVAGSAAEEAQVVTFVFDEKKHHAIGDHPATRLADVVSVMKESLTLTAEIFSYDYFSPHRAVAKAYMSGILTNAADSTRGRPGASDGGSVDGRQAAADDRRDDSFVEVATLAVPRQYWLPDNAFPDAASIPATLVHLTSEVSAAGPTHDIVYFQRIQRLSSNKSKWIDRTLVVLVPKRGSSDGVMHDDVGGVSANRSEFELVLCDDNGIVHRRIDGRSILAINIVRDVVMARRGGASSSGNAPQGCVMDFAIHGERRLIVRLVPCSSGVVSAAPASAPSSAGGGRQQSWVSTLPPAPQRVSMLSDASLPLPLLPATQLVNLLRRCCSFDFDESYDECRYWQPASEAGEGDDSKPKATGFHKPWSLLDPNEVTFMDRRMSIMRLDYFSRTPRSAAVVAPTPHHPSQRIDEDESLVHTPVMENLDAASNQPDVVVDPPLDVLQLVLQELEQRRGLHAEWIGGVDDLQEAFGTATEVALLEEASRFNPLDGLCAAEQDARSEVLAERSMYLLQALDEVWLELSLMLMSDAWQLIAWSSSVANCVSPHSVQAMLGEAGALKSNMLMDSAIMMTFSEKGGALLDDERRFREAMATLEGIRRATKLNAAWVQLTSLWLVGDHESLSTRLAAECNEEIAALQVLCAVHCQHPGMDEDQATAVRRDEEGSPNSGIDEERDATSTTQTIERRAQDAMCPPATSTGPMPVAASICPTTNPATINSTIPCPSSYPYDSVIALAEGCLVAKLQLLQATELGVWTTILCTFVCNAEVDERVRTARNESVERLSAEESVERSIHDVAWNAIASNAQRAVQVAAACDATRAEHVAAERLARQLLYAEGMLHEKTMVAAAAFETYCGHIDLHKRASVVECTAALAETNARATVCQQWQDVLMMLSRMESLSAMELRARHATATLERTLHLLSIEEPSCRMRMFNQSAVDAYNALAADALIGALVVYGDTMLHNGRLVIPLVRVEVVDEPVCRRNVEAEVSSFYRSIAQASFAQQDAIAAIAELVDEQERQASRIAVLEELEAMLLFEQIHEVWLREVAGRRRIEHTHDAALLTTAADCYVGAFSLASERMFRAWVWTLGLCILELNGRCSIEQMEAERFAWDIALWEPLYKRALAEGTAMRQQEHSEFRTIVGRFSDDLPRVKVLEFRRRLHMRQQDTFIEGACARREAIEAEEAAMWNEMSKQMVHSCERIELVYVEAQRRSVVAHEEGKLWAAIGHAFLKHMFFLSSRHRIREDENEGRAALCRDALTALVHWGQQWSCLLHECQQRQEVLDASLQDRQTIKQRAASSRRDALQSQVMSDIAAGRQWQANRERVGVSEREMRRDEPATSAVAPMSPPPVSVGAGAGAAAASTVQASTVNDGTTASPLPPTKIRVKFGNSFLQMYVASDDLLARIVKRGRADMREVHGASNCPPFEFCHCQCDRFRDVLMIRPSSLAQAFFDVRAARAASPPSLGGADYGDGSANLATIEVRSSEFRWVPIPWPQFFSNWLERSMEPVAQADDMMVAK